MQRPSSSPVRRRQPISARTCSTSHGERRLRRDSDGELLPRRFDRVPQIVLGLPLADDPADHSCRFGDERHRHRADAEADLGIRRRFKKAQGALPSNPEREGKAHGRRPIARREAPASHLTQDASLDPGVVDGRSDDVCDRHCAACVDHPVHGHLSSDCRILSGFDLVAGLERTSVSDDDAPDRLRTQATMMRVWGSISVANL